MNLTKTILVGVVVLCATISLFSANITILESQSIHPLHNMDENWQTTATDLGYNATISPQTILDDISNLNNTHVLIISSGLINLPPNRQQTIKEFVEQGGNVYIQAEYLNNLPGNALFADLVNQLGGNFNWGIESTGSLAPMNVIGDLTDNFTNVSTLTYYWYGASGSGDATIHSILEYDGLDWGFIFCPVSPTHGKIITTSDQDWVRTLNSEELMQNIVTYLVNHMPLSALPTVSIDMSQSGPCDDIIYTFDATIANTMGGTDLQWIVNGIDVIGENGNTYSSTDLADGDVVECRLSLTSFCTSYEHTSNPVLIAPIDPISTANLEITSNGNSFCENEMITFNAFASDLQNATNLIYQWIVNGTPVQGANATSFSINTLNDQDSVNCILTYDDDCFSNTIITATPIILNINQTILPSANITADQVSICEGETITFTANGTDLGTNPTYQWLIDGNIAGNNSPTFSTNFLSEGQNITCTITTNQICAVTNTITTNTISVNVTPLTTPTITISPDATEICPGETVTFTASGDNFGTNPSFQWQIDGFNVGNNSSEFTTNQLTNNQEVTCILASSETCVTTSTVSSSPVSIVVSTEVGPTVYIESNTNAICAGEEVSFTAFGNNFGSNPIFQWAIDGNPISNNGPVFTTNNLTSDQMVTCQVTNTEVCQSLATANSNALSVNISEVEVDILELEFENCGNADGIIEIEGIGGTSPYTYEWMNGEKSNLLTDLALGKFTVTITDAIGCTAIGQIEMGINEAPEVETLNITKADCDGDNGIAEIILTDTNLDYSFEWLNEEGTVINNTHRAQNLKTGYYTVHITNEFGCQTTETVIIDQISNIDLIISDDVQLELGESFQIETIVNSTDGATFQWSENNQIDCTTCESPTITPTESTTYTVTATNDYGCTAIGEIHVHVIPRRDVYIPNAFTPDNDGINDYFTVYAGENVTNVKSMQLFDRWGSVVFSKNDIAPNNEPEGWNGMHHGKKLQSGVYVYMIEIEYIDGKTKLHKGDVSITH